MADEKNKLDELKFDLSKVTARMVQTYNEAIRAGDYQKIAEVIVKAVVSVPKKWDIDMNNAEDWLDLPWADFFAAREQFTNQLVSVVKN